MTLIKKMSAHVHGEQLHFLNLVIIFSERFILVKHELEDSLLLCIDCYFHSSPT